MSDIHRVVVAIPARDEELLLAVCLRSVQRSITALKRLRPLIETVVVVGLDGCTDRSYAVAAQAGVRTETLLGVGVGATRDAAVMGGLSALNTGFDRHTWLACTDADTVVSSTWLTRQLMWAQSGMDLVMGTVEPADLDDPALLASWRGQHRLGEDHHYIHGANLGVRANTWRAVGGFGTLTTGEDVAFVARTKEHTKQWVATDTTRVITSGRLRGRANGGFADYLRALAEPQ